MSSQTPPPSPGKVGWLQTAGSVMASFFGVQSSRNRARDFQHGSPARFIVLGIVATAVFVFTVMLAVRLAMHHAGL
jgi:hypothetical protein